MATPIETEAPAWFAGAIAQPAHEYSVPEAAGALAYRCWNPDDGHKPGLLLAHGYRAHARWWDAVAPFLTERYRVYALDFAGMGDSARRDHYDAEVFTANLLSVMDHAGLAQATLVGHSYGGSRVMRACADFPERVRHAILLDSYVNFPDTDKVPVRRIYGTGPPYPDLDTAVARYRLLPEQPGEPYVRAHLARHSLRQVEQGWTWKFDRALPFAVFESDGPALLERITVPIDIVCGEHSAVVTPARARRIVQGLTASARVRGPIVLPGTHHHFMIDQPLALVTLLLGLLA